MQWRSTTDDIIMILFPAGAMIYNEDINLKTSEGNYSFGNISGEYAVWKLQKNTEKISQIIRCHGKEFEIEYHLHISLLNLNCWRRAFLMKWNCICYRNIQNIHSYSSLILYEECNRMSLTHIQGFNLESNENKWHWTKAP